MESFPLPVSYDHDTFQTLFRHFSRDEVTVLKMKKKHQRVSDLVLCPRGSPGNKTVSVQVKEKKNACAENMATLKTSSDVTAHQLQVVVDRNEFPFFGDERRICQSPFPLSFPVMVKFSNFCLL